MSQGTKAQEASGLAFIILTWYREEETYPDSVTTGAWSSEFSFRISMVFWQDTEYVTVRGADRCRLWTVRFHHLQDGKTEVLTPTCPVIPPLRGISYSWFGVFCYYGVFYQGFGSIWASKQRKPFSHIHWFVRNFDLQVKIGEFEEVCWGLVRLPPKTCLTLENLFCNGCSISVMDRKDTWL